MGESPGTPPSPVINQNTGRPMSELQESTRQQLRAIIERIERLEDEKAALTADIREVYAEAKGHGFDTKALRKIIQMRKKEAHERQEEEAVLTTYLHALGMLEDTPPWQAPHGEGDAPQEDAA